VELELSTFGAMIADRNRAGLLFELLDGRRIPASELAARVGISRSLASSHLAKLEHAGLISVEARGRHRLFQLAEPELAGVLERLAAVTATPPRTSGGLRGQVTRTSLAYARSCYDHLAGTLGVELATVFERERLLRRVDGRYEVTDAFRGRLEQLGVDVEAIERSRRPLARPCLDWTERRDHLAGAVGQALLTTLLARGVLIRQPRGRALAVTEQGALMLRAEWGLEVPAERIHGRARGAAR
jgi:DNA-binding transcriptional ArsR family regulator